MKVFISWSGNLSHKVARVLRDWLPSVIQSLEPYVSSEDIDKGTRWSTDISKELEQSTFGILCVTKENIDASWLNFEAGALSKAFDKSNVSPFLIGIKRAEIKGPILQFQSTIFEKDDIKKLLHSLNRACEPNNLKDERLDSIFEVWYPKLKEHLDLILQEIKPEEKITTEEKKTKQTFNNEILEEILELVRNQQKILKSPDILLPPDYIEYAFRNTRQVSPRMMDVIEDLLIRYVELREVIQNCKTIEEGELAEISDHIRNLGRPLEYLSQSVDKRMSLKFRKSLRF